MWCGRHPHLWVYLEAAVSAGRANWTPVKNMKAGTLTAAVTFEFVYR